MTESKGQKLVKDLKEPWARVKLAQSENIRINLLKTPSGIIMLEVSGQKPSNQYTTPMTYTALLELYNLLKSLISKQNLLEALSEIEQENLSKSERKVYIIDLDNL
ncbi:MAG: hypothetical protein QXR31_04445 [Zestosphaera sp.]